jgi:DNA-binding transcriptional LysR family regulator
MVLRGEAHIGIGRPIRHPDITLIPVLEDEMVLVVSARHAFARRGKVRMDELAAERLVLFDRTSSYHDLTSSLFRQAGVVPASTLELDNVEAAKKMVQQGLGVALLPRMALSSELKSGSLRPVKLVGAPPLSRPIVALRRKDAGEAIGPVAGFLETLKDVLG